MPSISFRPAQFRDYKSVMEISQNIFDGFDYLPSRFHIYLQHKDCYCFVAEYQGKVIGFSVLHVLDNGTSLLSEGGRIDTRFQNKGVITGIILFGLQYVRERVKTLAVMTHAAFDGPGVEKLVKMCHDARPPERLVYRLHCLTYKDEVEVFQTRISESGHLNAYTNLSRTITTDGMRELIADPRNILSIFPTGFFSAGHNGTPFRAWPNNILEVTSSHVCLVSEPSRGALSAISFGYAVQAVFGTRYDMAYFGDADSKTVASHMIKHMKNAVAICSPKQSLGILFQFQESSDLSAAKAAMLPYLGSNLKTHTFSSEGAYLFESPLPSAMTPMSMAKL